MPTPNYYEVVAQEKAEQEAVAEQQRRGQGKGKRVSYQGEVPKYLKEPGQKDEASEARLQISSSTSLTTGLLSLLNLQVQAVL